MVIDSPEDNTMYLVSIASVAILSQVEFTCMPKSDNSASCTGKTCSGFRVVRKSIASEIFSHGAEIGNARVFMGVFGTVNESPG